MEALKEYSAEEFADQLQSIQKELLVSYRPKVPNEPQAYLLGGAKAALERQRCTSS